MTRPPLRRSRPFGLTRLGVAVAVVVFGTPSARADEPSAERLAKVMKPAKVAPAKATLHVTPGALGTPWTFELTNDDTTPLRLAADGRLLTLDVTPDADGGAAEGATRPRPKRSMPTVHCALPAEIRPSTDADKARVLAPGVTYVEEFDPRFYCFDAHDAAALVPFAKLVAHLGWSPRTGAGAPPFVVDESLGGDHRAGVKELVSDEVTVPDTLSSEPVGFRARALSVRAPSRIDAETGQALVFDVTVTNTTTRPVRLMLRPETLAFEVASPRGVHECAWKKNPGAPIAEVLTFIPPRGEASTNLLLATVCPDATFESAGIYTVQARIDTRRASGRPIGIETFDGVVLAGDPTLVRIRHDRARRP